VLELATVELGQPRVQRVAVDGQPPTWTVIGADFLPVDPVEQFLEFCRSVQRSPNTVKSYARALALWWEFLGAYDRSWETVELSDFGHFVRWLRFGETPTVQMLKPTTPRFSDETIYVRVHAVMSFYRFHLSNGVKVAPGLYERVFASGRGYKPFLEHVARQVGRDRLKLPLRRVRNRPMPILTPPQMTAIRDACATWDAPNDRWAGSLRDRLLFALLEETGMRLGEALGVFHCDWHTGRGDTPYVEVVEREHAHGIRAKSGYRRIYISDDLDALYSDYLYDLCWEHGADRLVADLDEHYVFVNLFREPRLAPLRPETVADKVSRLRTKLADTVPVRWTPHWYRHSHATALLLAGTPVHVVSRRLGHLDVQTTLGMYGWVTDDAEMQALADWKRATAAWRVVE
jgi:integrase